MNLNKELNRTKRLGLIFFPAFDWAISPDHPEREERLLYTRDQLFEEGLLDRPEVSEFNPLIASREDVERVHFCIPDVSNRVSEPHLISAGGAIRAARLLLEDKVDSAFALVRPPGHHAFRLVRGARGFCTINNEAIMLEWLRHHYRKGLKIAIIDTDAHHADGTQDIFYHDPNVLHISLHQDGRTLFPGSGFPSQCGGPTAFARTLNIPLPPYTTDEGIEYVLENLILPVLDDFKPDIIINDAGQDNHYSDPLTQMMASAHGYARLTEKLQPDLVILQGGYSIEAALPYINIGLVLALAGLDTANLREPDYVPIRQDSRLKDRIKETVQQVRELWESRDSADLADLFRPYHQVVRGKKKQFYKRKKQIYYDTDGILEEQIEKVRWHEKCPGYLTIASRSRDQNDYHVFAVHIPATACQECLDDARAEYEGAVELEEGYDLVQLQNLPENQFLSHPQKRIKV
ncbi:MAG: histone deacetylase [Halanaerobium sp.]|nr:histone deacetylase [Halanaerobium sp.]